jgi:hypothetical protein
MTTAASATAFEQYVERALPDYLRGLHPVPPTWDGPEDEWRSLQEAARAAWRHRALLDFADKIAGKGFYPNELVRGELRPGAVMSGVSGAVQRPRAPVLVDLIPRAAKALREGTLFLETLVKIRLREIAEGSGGNDRRGALLIIEQAERAITAAASRQAQAKAESEARTLIRVIVPFSSTGGKTWRQGEHRLSIDQLEDLEDWRDKQEAFAAQRAWDKPEGFGVWPPYERVLTPLD